MEKETKTPGGYQAPALKLLPTQLERLVCTSPKTDVEANAGLFEEEIWS